jgi:hypothetical protein
MTVGRTSLRQVSSPGFADAARSALSSNLKQRLELRPDAIGLAELVGRSCRGVRIPLLEGPHDEEAGNRRR